MMGGEISLDSSYRSGLDGCPGARFVIDLPVTIQNASGHCTASSDESTRSESSVHETTQLDLPEELDVLLVDDDSILRKMMKRSLQRLAPGWKIREAANGETALALVEDMNFDLIFMDQYLASVEKQLLGTETVATMRSRNVKSRICGLSANDIRDTFLAAGADDFLLKPFSTNKEALRHDMCRVLDISDTQ